MGRHPAGGGDRQHGLIYRDDPGVRNGPVVLAGKMLGTAASPKNGPAVGTITAPTWAPPAPARTLPSIFPDNFEVRVFATAAGMTLVGAIELVSPANKDRPESRRAFAAKCASYLYHGI